MIDGLTSGQDSSFSIIEQAYLDDLMHRNMELKDRVASINTITKEGIMAVSTNLHLVAQSIVKEDNHETV